MTSIYRKLFHKTMGCDRFFETLSWVDPQVNAVFSLLAFYCLFSSTKFEIFLLLGVLFFVAAFIPRWILQISVVGLNLVFGVFLLFVALINPSNIFPGLLLALFLVLFSCSKIKKIKKYWKT